MLDPVAIVARGTVEDVDAILARAADQVKKHDVFLQLVDPRAVFNLRHLQSAWLHAERAQREGRMAAKTLGAEFLMYLTGERQVHHALDKAGVRPGAERTIICAAGTKAATAIWGLLDKLGWSRDPAGVPTNPSALEHLGVTPGRDPEASVLERVALLDVRK